MLGVYVWVAPGTWARGPTDLGANQSHSLLAPFPTRYAPARPTSYTQCPMLGLGLPWEVPSFQDPPPGGRGGAGTWDGPTVQHSRTTCGASESLAPDLLSSPSTQVRFSTKPAQEGIWAAPPCPQEPWPPPHQEDCPRIPRFIQAEDGSGQTRPPRGGAGPVGAFADPRPYVNLSVFYPGLAGKRASDFHL